MFDSAHPLTGGEPGAPRQRATTVVAIPGTGSDAEFAHRAFAPAATDLGLRIIAVEPDPGGIVTGYQRALAAAARSGPIVVAGISLGAAIAVHWASEHPDQVHGVVAALPAWTGADSTDCPAAASAAMTAAQLRADGFAPVVERMRASSPAWLAEALTQSWTAQWPHLPRALEEAAAYRWPELELLGTLRVPVAVVTAVDDPVHPCAVAEQWAATIPNARLHRTALDELGTDPAILGQLGLGWLYRRHDLAACTAER